MFAVYKKLLYYVPKQRPLAYIAIGLTVVSTLLNVGAYYYLYEFLKRLDVYKRQYQIFVLLMMVFWLGASQIDITYPLRVQEIYGSADGVGIMYTVYALSLIHI